MKPRIHWMIGLSLAASVSLVGCSSDGMSKKELDSLKNSPRMTDADRARVAEGMRKGGEARQSQQADWAAKNPEEVARINAERAKMGRPPLPGG